MKFGGHQSFHLRDQWLHKGLHWAVSSPQSFANTEDSIEAAMAMLGVGKNMAASIKYWLKAARLIKTAAAGYALTTTAQKILKNDPYFELDGTLFLIHHLIASNKEEAPAWHWFFNHFSAAEFERESLNNQFFSYMQAKSGKAIKDKTLEKELSCLLKMYQTAEWKGAKNPETENPSPFAKYGWIEKRGESFVRNKLNIFDMSAHIFSFILYIFWQEGLGLAESVQLEDLTLKENSPGRIFRFSLEEMSDLLDACAREGYLNYSRTGGYLIVRPDERRLRRSLNNYYREKSLS